MMSLQSFSLILVICPSLILHVTPQQQQQQQFQFQDNFNNIPNRLLPFFQQPPIQFVQRLQRQFFQQQQRPQNFQQSNQQFQQQQPQQNFRQFRGPQQNFQSNDQQFQQSAQQFQVVQQQPQQQSVPPQRSNQQFQQQQPQQNFQQSNQQFQQQPQQQSVPPQRSEPMNEACLACLCHASSSCNLSTQCVSEGKYCGPFLLSQPYWLDAGSPVLLGDSPLREGAFQDCATDPVCSAQAVRNYMTKYMKDCNGDGKIDCDDLGRIHLLGASGCTDKTANSSPFYQRFLGCFSKASQLSVG